VVAESDVSLGVQIYPRAILAAHPARTFPDHHDDRSWRAQVMGSPLAPGSGRFAHLVHALHFEGLHDLRIARERSTLHRARKAQPCP
jgi:hypothetical protein